jgi:hypothetical protein
MNVIKIKLSDLKDAKNKLSDHALFTIKFVKIGPADFF